MDNGEDDDEFGQNEQKAPVCLVVAAKQALQPQVNTHKK
jgi:hypothetical protein